MSINTTYECIEMFKHGVADALLKGTRDDNRGNNFWYKSGYDYGITLHGRTENLDRYLIPKRAFYVELSIPNTKKTMGFYSYGTSREDAKLGFVDPFILEEDKEYDFNVKVLGIDETE
jgi:hypothetical protein